MREVIIIGSGPAGYTAAIYAARAQLNPLMIASSVEPGGELMKTTEVENYPGFPEGLMGPDLMANFQAQAERFGTEIMFDDVVEVDLTGDVKIVKTGGGETLEAKAVIISTGAAYRELGLPREKELSGHGVSWCATCDGFFFREKTIAVVGGGDSAMEEANFLTKFASKVYVIHRRDSLKASKIMQQRAFDNEKIEFVWNSAIAELKGDVKLEGVVLENTEPARNQIWPLMVCLLLSEMTRGLIWLRTRWSSLQRDLSKLTEGPQKHRCRASLQQAMLLTRPTVKQSPQRDPVVWPPSMQNTF